LRLVHEWSQTHKRYFGWSVSEAGFSDRGNYETVYESDELTVSRPRFDIDYDAR
jgi:hypothetical protein